MDARTDQQLAQDRETLVTLIKQDQQFLAEAYRGVVSTQARLRILKGVLNRTDEEINTREKQAYLTSR